MKKNCYEQNHIKKDEKEPNVKFERRREKKKTKNSDKKFSLT